MTALAIILGCDCDPDRPGFAENVSETSLSWQGIERGIPRFMSKRRVFYNKTGLWPKMTWFVRADHQVKLIHGDAGYCLDKYQDLWRSLEAEGDEIAWHPHLWAWDDKAKRWYQKIGDDEFTSSCLTDGLEAFERVWGVKPKTTHAGWCYQDNETMKFMSDNGLLADCSAVPSHNTLGHGLSDQADWRRAPSTAYYPNLKNYRIAASSLEERLNILEVPASVGGGGVARVLKVIRDQVKRRSIRLRMEGFKKQVPLMTLAPLINRTLISDAVATAKNQSLEHFLSYTHCDEFLDQSGKSLFAGITYSLDAFFKNVANLNRRCQEAGIEPEFKTLHDFSSELIFAKES